MYRETVEDHYRSDGKNSAGRFQQVRDRNDLLDAVESLHLSLKEDNFLRIQKI